MSTVEQKIVGILDITPYPFNTKLHTATQVRRIANSITTYGWDQPIVVDKEMVIIKGHGRYAAAQSLGLTEVPIIIQDLTDEEARLARIADNKVAESEWDKDLLWGEISAVKEKGLVPDSLGFSDKLLAAMFPDVYISPDDKKAPEEKVSNKTAFGDRDNTMPEKEGFIKPFSGELAWLRRLSMADFLDWHEKIVVGFSSGKDSLACLLWILENCDPSKVMAIYTNPGWGVDWPHSLYFIELVKQRFGIKVWMAGKSDPAGMGAWEENLVQLGFPGMRKGCWIESKIKIPQITALMAQEKIGSKFGMKTAHILGIRWEESAGRAKTYPDRGILKDTGNHYASPVIEWTGTDVAKYLDSRGIRLHTAYENENRMGCLICPKGSPTGAISLRKKFPKHYMKALDWFAMGARKSGRVSDSMQKFLLSIEDKKVQSAKFTTEYGAIAIGSEELEGMIREITGKEYEAGFLSEPYKAAFGLMHDDLKDFWWNILERNKT